MFTSSFASTEFTSFVAFGSIPQQTRERTHIQQEIDRPNIVRRKGPLEKVPAIGSHTVADWLFKPAVAKYSRPAPSTVA